MKANAIELLARFVERHSEVAPALESLATQLSMPGTDIEVRSTMQGHLTSSVFVLDVTQTKVLLIHHKHYDMWIQPGGHYEHPGSLWDSACREVAEETGLTDLMMHPLMAQSGLPLDIDTHPIAARPSKNEGPHVHHDFAFLALATREFVPTPQLEEVHGVKWLALDAVASLPDVRIRRMARKVQHLLEQAAVPA